MLNYNLVPTHAASCFFIKIKLYVFPLSVAMEQITFSFLFICFGRLKVKDAAYTSIKKRQRSEKQKNFFLRLSRHSV